jgi:hypothetical protein
MYVRETERACEKDNDQSVRQTETVYPWQTEPCRRDKTFFLKGKQRQIVREIGRGNLSVVRQIRVSPCDRRRLCIYSTAAELTVRERRRMVCLWERQWYLFGEIYEDSLSVIDTDKAIGLQEKRRQSTCVWEGIRLSMTVTISVVETELVCLQGKWRHFNRDR